MECRKLRPCASLALLAIVTLFGSAAAQSATWPYGAYLGCFNLTQLEGISNVDQPARFQTYSINKCAGYCRSKGVSLNAVSPSLACYCSSVIPSDAARADDAACAADGDGVALFYNHLNVDDSSCRVANVPMDKSNFNFHYNDYHATVDQDGVLNLKMEGNNGLRFTTKDGMHLYGMYQVSGMINNASGAVTAFYTRSSDDYNTENHGDFSEIDFEFLNGNPSVPAGLWLNSFHKGMSGGERLVKPEEYRPMLGLAQGEDASTDFLTYSFNWQPDQVVWYTNGVKLLKRGYDDEVHWKDMKGVAFSRIYRPPSYPQHITFSMWSDQDQSRAFGGKLAWDRSPFISKFKDLRRVLCDLPAPTPTTNGPTWLYGKDTTIPAPETTAAQNAAPAKDAAVPPTAATKIVKKILKKGHFDEKVGTKSTANPAKKHEVKQKKTL